MREIVKEKIQEILKPVFCCTFERPFAIIWLRFVSLVITFVIKELLDNQCYASFTIPDTSLKKEDVKSLPNAIKKF